MDNWRSNTLALSDLNSDGVLDLVTGGFDGGASNQYTIRHAATRDGVSLLLPFDLSTMGATCQALPIFKQNYQRRYSGRVIDSCKNPDSPAGRICGSVTGKSTAGYRASSFELVT